jgi:hypothetical protein
MCFNKKMSCVYLCDYMKQKSISYTYYMHSKIFYILNNIFRDEYGIGFLIFAKKKKLSIYDD